MENHFSFLGQARPPGLYRLLQKLPLDDAAAVLAGLPPALSVQVMAFFPETSQQELMPAMREARRSPPEKAAKIAEGIREMLLAAKAKQPGAAPPAQPPAPKAAPDRQPKPAPRPAGADRPTPWVPRAADRSPINGPAIPGKPPSATGDPFQSPLAKAGLLDLIGRAQQKLMPKNTVPPRARAPRPDPAPNRLPPAGKAPPGRPAAREGVVSLRSVGLDGTPRVIGGSPAPKAPKSGAAPSGGARRMDGKAILAAILRQSEKGVRDNVQHDDPSLYRELRGRMFYFDDLIFTEDAALARVFTAAPVADAALALKFAAPALRDRVLRVVSPGRAGALRESSPARAGLDAVENAQKKVLDVALQLQAAGRILIDPRDPDLAG